MKAVIMLFAAILGAGCISVAGPQASAPGQTQAGAEAALAAALSGRVAGPPQDCVNQSDLGDNTAYGWGVILFKGRTDDVVYVNRPGGCSGLNFGRAVKTQTTTTRLCRGDTATVFDPISGTEYGTKYDAVNNTQYSDCRLGEFTPYRLAR